MNMNHETHYCCDKRLLKEGARAKCCECHGCPWCKESASVFSPEHIQAAIRGSNADQKAMMEKAKTMTNKTNKLIESFGFAFNELGHCHTTKEVIVKFADSLAQSAREEERGRWEEKLKEVLPVVRGDMLCKCNPDDIDDALVHIEELILSPNKEEDE